MALTVASGAHAVAIAARRLTTLPALRPADDVVAVLHVVDERPVDVGQLAEGQRADGEPVVVERARELGREGQRDVEHLAADQAGRAGDHVGLQLGAEIVPRRNAIGPVRRRQQTTGVVDDPQVAEGERHPRRHRRLQRRQLRRMPDVVLIARRDEGGLGRDALVAALERPPRAGTDLVLLADERPLDALLGVDGVELALQARGLGLVDAQADGDHGPRIAHHGPSVKL